MTFAASVARNTIVQVAGKVAGTLLGFAVVVILTRYLGQAGYGEYTTVMAYLGFFSVVADLGLYLIVVREMNQSTEPPEKVLGNILSIRAISAVTVLGLGIAIAGFFPYPQIVKQAIQIGALAYFFVALNQLFVGLFQTHLAMHRVVFGEIFGRIALLVAVLLLTRAQAGLLAIMGAIILGSAVNVVATYAFASRLVRVRFRFDFPYWRKVLVATAPLAISVILNLIYFRIDTIFLSLFRSAEVVGLYGVAYKVLEILVTFPNMFIGLVLPVLAATAFTDPKRFAIVFQKSFDVLLLASLPIVVGGWFIATPLMRLVGGEEFAGAAPFFRILLFAAFFLFFGSLSGHTIVAIRKQQRMVWAYLGVALLGVILYLSLIPAFGAVGAAIGTVITEFVIMFIGFLMILRTMHLRLSFGMAGKAVIACAALGLILFVLRDMPFALQIIAGVAVYVLILFLLRGIPTTILRELLSFRRGTAPPEDIGSV